MMRPPADSGPCAPSSHLDQHGIWRTLTERRLQGICQQDSAALGQRSFYPCNPTIFSLSSLIASEACRRARSLVRASRSGLR